MVKERYFQVKLTPDLFNKFGDKVNILSTLIEEEDGSKIDKSAVVRKMIKMFIKNPSRFYGEVKNSKGQLV